MSVCDHREPNGYLLVYDCGLANVCCDLCVVGEW